MPRTAAEPRARVVLSGGASQLTGVPEFVVVAGPSVDAVNAAAAFDRVAATATDEEIEPDYSSVFGFRDGHLPVADGLLLLDHLIDEIFDLLEFFGSHLRGMREVES
jgi:hypothetical protein